jgi:hypothetical protein
MTAASKAVSAAMRTWLFLARQDVKVTKFNIRRLRRRNQETTKPIIAPGGPVVSLTSFGERLQTVYLTIESIGVGSLLPSRLILWIQEEESFRCRPHSLRRLEARGLEVRLTNKYGPHTKYFPYIMSTDTFGGPLATADDDTLYSMWWLYGLSMAHKENPRLINCYRAHFMRFTNGKINPYLNWEARKSTQPSARCFATGSSGCIYPAEFLVKLKRTGDYFLQFCPWADDVWLHVNALRTGFKIRQIAHRPLDFPVIPGTQKIGLFNKNWHQTGNDEQIRRTYTTEDIELLMSELRPQESSQAVSGEKDKLAITNRSII